MLVNKKDIINQLQNNSLKWQGFTPPSPDCDESIDLGPIEAALPAIAQSLWCKLADADAFRFIGLDRRQALWISPPWPIVRLGAGLC